MRHESEPALIFVFSCLLRLSEVKYHWSTSGKGEKIVNLLFLMRTDKIVIEAVN